MTRESTLYFLGLPPSWGKVPTALRSSARVGGRGAAPAVEAKQRVHRPRPPPPPHDDRRRTQALVAAPPHTARRLSLPPARPDRPLHRRLLLRPGKTDRRTRRRPPHR